MGEALAADMSFARPYHFWERRLNEHTNGLVCQDFGKGESLLDLDPARVQGVAEPPNVGPPQRSRNPHPHRGRRLRRLTTAPLALMGQSPLLGRQRGGLPVAVPAKHPLSERQIQSSHCPL